MRLGSPPSDPRRGSPRWPVTLKRLASMFHRTQHTLAHVDPEIWAAVQAENRRQEEHIELIASENYTSRAVMEEISPASQAGAVMVSFPLAQRNLYGPLSWPLPER